MADLHEPDAYFDRLDSLYLDQRIEPESTRLRHLRRRPWRLMQLNIGWLIEAAGIFSRLMRRVPEQDLRRVYRQRLWKLLWRRPSPVILQIYAIKCAMHYHAHLMIKQMKKETELSIHFECWSYNFTPKEYESSTPTVF